MPRLTSEQEETVKTLYGQLGSLRKTAAVSGHGFNTVQRIVGGGSVDPVASPDEWDSLLDRLEARMVARLAASGPVNEGPPAPQSPGGLKIGQPGVTVRGEIPRRTVWLSDLHYPYQDQGAVECALDFCRDWKPSLIIIGGDLFDSYLISGYEKSPEQLNHHLQREFDLAKPFVEAIDGMGAEVVYILGNHEARIDALIAKNPGLAKLRALEWHRMAELPARWEILPQHSRYRIGGLDFHHGDLKQGPGGRYVAARLLEDLKRSSLFGHFHRSQVYSEPDGDGVLRAGFSVGHLCNTTEAAKYCRLNRWATGFASVDMDPATELFEVRSHLIHGGKMQAGGKTYG